MSQEITIRQAEKCDLQALGRLGATLMRVHHAFDPDRFLSPDANADQGYAWFLGTQLEERGVVVLVAERDGEILGYVYAGLEPMSWKELRGPAGFIHDVVVDETARRAGIAGMLVERAAAWLEERGAPRILVWTAEKNAASQELFERAGFRRTMLEMTREVAVDPHRTRIPPVDPEQIS